MAKPERGSSWSRALDHVPETVTRDLPEEPGYPDLGFRLSRDDSKSPSQELLIARGGTYSLDDPPFDSGRYWRKRIVSYIGFRLMFDKSENPDGPVWGSQWRETEDCANIPVGFTDDAGWVEPTVGIRLSRDTEGA